MISAAPHVGHCTSPKMLNVPTFGWCWIQGRCRMYSFSVATTSCLLYFSISFQASGLSFKHSAHSSNPGNFLCFDLGESVRYLLCHSSLFEVNANRRRAADSVSITRTGEYGPNPCMI